MEDDFQINKLSIILFIIFVLFIIIVFFVINNSGRHVKGYVGRYISSADIDNTSLETLKKYNIETNGKIKYELILKNDETFIFYIDSVKKIAYTGELSRSLNKYTLNIFRTYDMDKKCYNYTSERYTLKKSNSTFTTSEITDQELSFIKYDDNITKYDDIINDSIIECGAPVNY